MFSFGLSNDARKEQEYCSEFECCTTPEVLCFGASFCFTFSANTPMDLRIDIYLKLCLPLIKSTLEAISLQHVWDGCLAKLRISYYPARGQIAFGLDINLWIVKFEAQGAYQIASPLRQYCTEGCDFNDKEWCYLPRGSYSPSFKIFVGFSVVFFSYYYEIYSYEYEYPDCEATIGAISFDAKGLCKYIYIYIYNLNLIKQNYEYKSVLLLKIEIDAEQVNIFHRIKIWALTGFHPI